MARSGSSTRLARDPIRARCIVMKLPSQRSHTGPMKPWLPGSCDSRSTDTMTSVIGLRPANGVTGTGRSASP